MADSSFMQPPSMPTWRASSRASRYASAGVPSATRRSATSPIFVFVGLALLSALAFAARSIVLKQVPTGTSPANVLMLQGGFSLPLLWLVARWQRTSLRPNPVLTRAYVSRVFWGLGQVSLLLYSIATMPVALASTFAHTAPLFVAVLAPVLLRERSKPAAALLAGVGFLGVAVNALPHLQGLRVSTLLSGLGTGFCGAMMHSYSRRLAAAGDSAARGVFLVQCASLLAGLVGCFATGNWNISIHAVVVCFCGAALSAIAQLSSASAYRFGKALTVSSLSLLTLPLTLLMAVVFLRVDVCLLETLGMLLTLAACASLAHVERAPR